MDIVASLLSSVQATLKLLAPRDLEATIDPKLLILHILSQDPRVTDIQSNIVLPNGQWPVYADLRFTVSETVVWMQFKCYGLTQLVNVPVKHLKYEDRLPILETYRKTLIPAMIPQMKIYDVVRNAHGKPLSTQKTIVTIGSQLKNVHSILQRAVLTTPGIAIAAILIGDCFGFQKL